MDIVFRKYFLRPQLSLPQQRRTSSCYVCACRGAWKMVRGIEEGMPRMRCHQQRRMPSRMSLIYQLANLKGDHRHWFTISLQYGCVVDAERAWGRGALTPLEIRYKWSANFPVKFNLETQYPITLITITPLRQCFALTTGQGCLLILVIVHFINSHTLNRDQGAINTQPAVLDTFLFNFIVRLIIQPNQEK
jgi:hypothetical protein